MGQHALGYSVVGGEPGGGILYFYEMDPIVTKEVVIRRTKPRAPKERESEGEACAVTRETAEDARTGSEPEGMKGTTIGKNKRKTEK